MLGLGKRLDHLPSALSGGQQQRVAIARALANKPAILFADEPTGNLDGKSGKEVLALLKYASRELGVTLVLVTHDLNIAEQAERVITLEDGAHPRQQEGGGGDSKFSLALHCPGNLRRRGAACCSSPASSGATSGHGAAVCHTMFDPAGATLQPPGAGCHRLRLREALEELIKGSFRNTGRPDLMRSRQEQENGFRPFR